MAMELIGDGSLKAVGGPACRRTCNLRGLKLFVLLVVVLAVLPTLAFSQARTIWGSGYAVTGTAPNNGFTFSLPGANGTVSYSAGCHTGIGIVTGTTTNVVASGPNVGTAGFYNPAIPANTPAANLNFNRDSTVAGCGLATNTVATGSLSFSAAVDPNALRFHFVNVDAGTYQFNASTTPGRLAGNNIFDVVGQRVNSVAASPLNVGCQANDGGNPAASCGTVNFTSSSATITSMGWVGQDVDNGAGAGDGHAVAISINQPSLLIRKRTISGTDSTSFTINYPSNVVTNAAAGNVVATTETIAAAANNSFVSGQQRYIANSGLNATITEAVPSGWQMTSAQCIDIANGNAVLATLSGPVNGPANASITLAAANITPTSQIQCDFTNTFGQADLSVTKTNGVNVLQQDTQTTYTIVASNSGPAAADGAVIADVPNANLDSCAVNNCAAAGGASCPATPGNILQATGTAIPTFPSGGSVTFTLQCHVH